MGKILFVNACLRTESRTEELARALLNSLNCDAEEINLYSENISPLDMAGLESKHYSVHKLRHTAATLMYQTGNVDIRVLKDILGHEQLNTTQIYTHVSDINMMNAMAQNPLAEITETKADKPEENKDKT